MVSCGAFMTIEKMLEGICLPGCLPEMSSVGLPGGCLPDLPGEMSSVGLPWAFRADAFRSFLLPTCFAGCLPACLASGMPSGTSSGMTSGVPSGCQQVSSMILK